MNTYIRILICLTAIAVLAAPSCAQSTPFVIGGWIFNEGGTACDYPAVNITNLDTGVEWQAETNISSNYYQITRANGTDLNATDILQFNVTNPGEDQSNTTKHTVTQGEIDNGGIFNFNVTLASPAASPTLVEYTISNRTITPPQTTEIDVEFSERVKWKIAIENGGVVYDWTGTSTNPYHKTWNGTYDGTDTIVPDGTYVVNITWTNTTTDLGGQNNTETIIVSKPPASITDLRNITYEQTYINWTWTDPKDADFAKVMVYINGMHKEDVLKGVQCYNATALTPDIEYEIATRTVDDLGNINDTWKNHTAWTKPCTAPEIDLIVESITVNCGYLFGNESNNISAVIKNNGSTNAPASHASFVLNGYSEIVAVSALASGASETVTITDPTIRDAGAAVTVTVTADCNGEVSEIDETNNVTTLDITVVNNGYKGKTYTGGSNMTTWETFDLNGNLIYSLGDSYYLGGYSGWSTPNYTANWTASDLPVPTGATVKEVRLYVPYCFDYQGDMPDNLSLIFNGNAQTLEKHYTDRKSHGSWDNPYGMLTYNVTDDFDTSKNIANLTNLNPKCCEQKTVAIRGMMLVVIYEDANEPRRQIFVGEEFDLLYGGSGKCTTPEEATAWAPITGPAIELAMVADATLITVAPGAGPTEGELFFNGHVWNDVWSFAGATQIGVSDRDVTSYLESTGNLVGFQSNGDYMEASNAILIVRQKALEDLIVESITVNCGYLFGNESNNISAVIKNNGSTNAPASHASFVLNGYSEIVAVSALASGASETVTITDPTIRDAGAAVTVTVTADCNGEVSEIDETNNVTTLDITVVNNGYKGKTYTGGSNMTTWETFDLNGNLIYSLGDSYYLGGYSGWSTPNYTANWTASDLPVPTGATVKEVRLYVPYCFDYQGDMPDNLSLIFNGNAQTLEKHYTDRKSHGSWDNPYGMLTYNVTDDFDTSKNIANLTNLNPKCCEQKTVAIRGMMLVVIYEDANEPRRQIFVGEEFDLLYGGSGKCTTPEEATAWAPITGPAIELAMVADATLITVAPGAGPTEGELFFNGHVWNDVWSFAGATQIGVSDRDVTSYLESTGNLVGFQSNGDYMEASNAILIVRQKSEVTTPPAITTATPSSPVSDIEGAARTFSITIDQEVNVTWLLDGSQVQTNESVTSASYTDTSAAVGTWNVSAVVENANGTDMQTWWWTVTAAGTGTFDTGGGTYPSIRGTHWGNFTPNCDITVNKMYTYPCSGTGGHSEYVAFYKDGVLIAEGIWSGYLGGDYHNIVFDEPFTLHAGAVYNYEIVTGSYPQMIHSQTYGNADGTITCTEFIDANGKVYTNRIPAIRLE